MKENGIYIGKVEKKIEKITKIVNKPKKKFRIIIQERLSKGNNIEKARSFMVYDFKGNVSIDTLKTKLQKSLKGDTK